MMTNLHSLVMSKFTILLFVVQLAIPSATSVSFKLPTISNNKGKIILAGDSHYTPLGLQFNPDPDYANMYRQETAGRAIYIEPLHLWSNQSKKVASFTTTFRFVIDSSGSSQYADGFTFFLGESSTVLTRGGGLGLAVVPDTGMSIARFVAVEFDTFGENEWDPENKTFGDHVGIDVNSLSSAVYQKWSTNIPLGLEYEATVSYYSVTKVLSVVYTGYQGTTKVQQDALRYTVDLTKELPEWVIFGFTAATGGWTEKHTLLSWNFKSTTI